MHSPSIWITWYSFSSQSFYSGEVQAVIRSLVVDVLRFALLFNLEFSGFKCDTLFFTVSKILVAVVVFFFYENRLQARFFVTF